MHVSAVKRTRDTCINYRTSVTHFGGWVGKLLLMSALFFLTTYENPPFLRTLFKVVLKHLNGSPWHRPRTITCSKLVASPDRNTPESHTLILRAPILVATSAAKESRPTPGRVGSFTATSTCRTRMSMALRGCEIWWMATSLASLSLGRLDLSNLNARSPW